MNELSVDPKSPFTPEIDRVQADMTKKMPPLETYDDTDNPYDHTHTFDRLICYYEHSDGAWCQMFVVNLKKGARLRMT